MAQTPESDDSTNNTNTAAPSRWSVENKENPTATRPAAAGGEYMRLLTLEEATENGSDGGMSEGELRVVKVPKKCVSSRCDVSV